VKALIGRKLFKFIQRILNAIRRSMRGIRLVNDRSELEIDNTKTAVGCAVCHISHSLILVSHSVGFKYGKNLF